MRFVDEQIPRLSSLDPAHRAAARADLFEAMCHQGTRSMRTAYGVPILLGLIADPATPERAALLEPMALFAVGFDEGWLPDPFPIADYRAFAVDENAVPPERLERLSFCDLECEVPVYDAVRGGVPLYRAFVAVPGTDPAMRVTAAGLLGWFPEDAAGSLPVLVRAAREPGERLRATALLSIGLLGGAPDPVYLDDPSPIVRVAAAIALVRVLGRSAPAAAAPTLLARTARADDPNGDAGVVPFLGGDLGGYAAASLSYLTDRPGEVLDALLARLAVVDGVPAVTVLLRILDHVYPNGKRRDPVPFAELTEGQRKLARTLAGSPGSWRLRSDRPGVFGNFSMPLRHRGLPGTPEAMRDYVAS